MNAPARPGDAVPAALAAILDTARAGAPLTDAQALALAGHDRLDLLAPVAAAIRDRAFGDVTTYSPKVFIPLTRLCRDVCHYCTFATTPSRLDAPYLSPEQVLAIARAGREAGCREALFTLGDRPEDRHPAARRALDAMGHDSTLDYVAAMAALVIEETGLLPHLNPGLMDAEQIAALRPHAASMGLMLESLSERLTRRGGPHFGSPDKAPALRLATLEAAGEARVPFTSGILIGIGETRTERIEALLALRASHARHGHLQEVIVQNFRPKPGTRMAAHPPATEADHLWTLAVARLVLPPDVSLQAPPNLAGGPLARLIAAGVDDWGGVSPVTPDHVNPEAPWPHLVMLAERTAEAGKTLAPRLAVRASHLGPEWLAPAMLTRALRASDAHGLVRPGEWSPGAGLPLPPVVEPRARRRPDPTPGRAAMREAIAQARAGARLSEGQLTALFGARGDDFHEICAQADALRREVCGDVVSYVITRNITYTNVCGYRCRFCAFSKGKMSENLRGRPYDMDLPEIAERAAEAWRRGATEVCIQGGIHPAYTGRRYLEILAAVKAAAPEMHVHAFSPLEIHQGAASLGLAVPDFLAELKAAGLGSLPGTAAEILDDEVRATLCPDKITTGQWLDVVGAAHDLGLRTTSTIMFGHIERPVHWARHLLRLRDLAARTGGLTEFVPLPFVPMEAPIYLKGQARAGATLRESILMHAVGRLALHPVVPNIQASWVKLGEDGVSLCLGAGANDFGGTLMDESISRAAGAAFGQDMSPRRIEATVTALGRRPRQRATLYEDAPAARRQAAAQAYDTPEAWRRAGA